MFAEEEHFPYKRRYLKKNPDFKSINALSKKTY